MAEQQSILVPQISTMPNHEARVRLLLRWLVQRNIVAAELSTCGRTGSRMAYAIAPGAKRIVEQPELLPFGRPVNGLEVVTKRCIYTPTVKFLEEAGCPKCRKEVGEALFDSLDEWMPKVSDNFTCPLCGFEDDINGFLFLQPCGFSNLGFIFNNWGGARFKAAFIEEFAERVGYPVRQVWVDCL